MYKSSKYGWRSTYLFSLWLLLLRCYIQEIVACFIPVFFWFYSFRSNILVFGAFWVNFWICYEVGSLVSYFCIFKTSCPNTLCWKDYSLPNILSWQPTENQLTVNTWVYLWTLSSIPLICMSVLIPVPHILDDCNFVVKFWDQLNVSSPTHYFPLQDCFDYSGSLAILYVFWGEVSISATTTTKSNKSLVFW